MPLELDLPDTAQTPGFRQLTENDCLQTFRILSNVIIYNLNVYFIFFYNLNSFIVFLSFNIKKKYLKMIVPMYIHCIMYCYIY